MGNEISEILKAFNDTAAELKKDIAGVSEKVMHINTILVGAGGGGVIAELGKLERNLEKTKSDFSLELEKAKSEFKKEVERVGSEARIEREKIRVEQEKLKIKVWTWTGAFAVLVVIANFILPRLIT